MNNGVIKAFLDYVEGILGEDELVREIDQEIRSLKEQGPERITAYKSLEEELI